MRGAAVIAFLLALFPASSETSARFQVYFFTAAWCGPCKAVYPILEKYQTKEPKCMDLTSIDFDRQREIASQFGVESVPVVVGAET